MVVLACLILVLTWVNALRLAIWGFGLPAVLLFDFGCTWVLMGSLDLWILIWVCFVWMQLGVMLDLLMWFDICFCLFVICVICDCFSSILCLFVCLVLIVDLLLVFIGNLVWFGVWLFLWFWSFVWVLFIYTCMVGLLIALIWFGGVWSVLV